MRIDTLSCAHKNDKVRNININIEAEWFCKGSIFLYLYQLTDCIFYLILCEFADAEQRGWRIRRHRSYRSESLWWRTEQVPSGWRLLLDCSIKKRWWTVKFPIPYCLPCSALSTLSLPSCSFRQVPYLWDFIIDDKISVNLLGKKQTKQTNRSPIKMQQGMVYHNIVHLLQLNWTFLIIVGWYWHVLSDRRRGTFNSKILW